MDGKKNVPAVCFQKSYLNARLNIILPFHMLEKYDMLENVIFIIEKLL